MNILDLKRRGYFCMPTDGDRSVSTSSPSRGSYSGYTTGQSEDPSSDGYDPSYGGGVNSVAQNAASSAAYAAAQVEADRVAEVARQERIATDKTNQKNQTTVNALASAPTTSSLSPGWTGNRSERDARDAGNTMAGHEDGRDAGFAPTAATTRMFNKETSYYSLQTMQENGQGAEDAPGNPGQTVDQALAARTFGDKVMPGVVGMIKAAVPGAGLLMSAAKQAGAVASGKKTLGAAIKDSAIDFGAGWTAGKINGLVGKEMAGLIGREGMIGLQTASSISGMLGGPKMPNIGAGLVNSALGAAGISKSTGPGYASSNTVAGDNGFVRDGSTYGTNDSSGFMVQPPVIPVAPAAPVANDWSMPDANLYDGHGWQAAKQKYFQSKGQLP